MILQTYGRQPGIYTSPGAWRLIFGACPKATQDWFAQAPLWTAQYGVTQPDMYGSWKSALMWQYQGEPDYSVFNGTDDEFAAWDGQVVIEPVDVKKVKHIKIEFSDNTSKEFDNVKNLSVTDANGVVNNF
jgi:hypothetical protein